MTLPVIKIRGVSSPGSSYSANSSKSLAKRPLKTSGGNAAFTAQPLPPDSTSHWDIIHYAGHSYYSSDPAINAGFLFFHDEHGLTRPVRVNRFLMHAIGTRLLYLSSCSSAEKHFIYEAAKNQVSHVIGFRSEIEDATAARFTRDFYERMFDLQSVEKAFYEVRKNLYDQHKKARDGRPPQELTYDWLKPVLVLDGYRG